MCSRHVFSKAVIDSVERQMDGYQANEKMPKRMLVQDCLRQADLSETVVRTKSLETCPYSSLSQ